MLLRIKIIELMRFTQVFIGVNFSKFYVQREYQFIINQRDRPKPSAAPFYSQFPNNNNTPPSLSGTLRLFFASSC